MNAADRKQIYVSLCEQGKVTGLFMQPWWLDATGQWEVALAIRNGQVVGAMPYAPGRKRGIATISMPAFTHHLRIWMDKPPDVSDHKWLTREKQIIWLLIDDLPSHGYFSMVFEENSFNNWLPFHWKNFRQEMRYTFVIDRLEESELDQNINRNLKRNLRDLYDMIEMRRDIDPDDFHSICTHTYKRQKMKMPYTYEQFARLDKALTFQKAGVRLGAYLRQGTLLAAAYLVWDRETAYFLLAGDNDEGRQSSAGILLCREALRIAFEEKKLATFDFCGSMLESITEIRRQFGARPQPLMKIFRARYKWLDVLYSLTR
jgi:hypothetical protein